MEAKPKTNKELLTNLTNSVLELKDVMDEIHTAIFGNSNPEKGLLIRVRDLEVFHKVVRRVMWIAVGAAVTSIVVAVLATKFGT